LKLIGCLLLFSGWVIVLATLDVLSAFTLRAGFVMAGMITEGLGLALLAYGYFAAQRSTK